MKKFNIISLSAYSLIMKSVGFLVGMLIAVVLARHLGPEEYGLYVFILAVVTTATIPIRLGLPKLLLRETAKNLRDGNLAVMFSIWRWAHLITFGSILSVLCVVILTIVLVPLEPRLQRGMLIGVLLIPMLSLMELRAGILQGLGKIIVAQLPDIVVRPILLLVLICVPVYLMGIRLSANVALSLQGIAMFIALMVGTSLLFYHRPVWVGGRQKLESKGALLWSALILGSVAGLQTLNANLDSLMLLALISPEAVGVYKAAALFTSVVPFGLHAVISVISHRLAEYSQGNRAQFQKLAQSSSRLVFLIALIPASVFFVAGPELLRFAFGDGFEGAAEALYILVIGQLVSAFFGPVGAILSMTGNEKVALRGVFLAASLNIILNSILIPVLGLIGAALATSTATICWNLLLWFEVRRRLHVNTIGTW